MLLPPNTNWDSRREALTFGVDRIENLEAEAVVVSLELEATRAPFDGLFLCLEVTIGIGDKLLEPDYVTYRFNKVQL